MSTWRSPRLRCCFRTESRKGASAWRARLTKSAALEYAPRGIRINAVCPGTIETPMAADMMASGELTVADAVAGQPIGRLGRGEEIAAAVLWLCTRREPRGRRRASRRRQLYRPLNHVQGGPPP